MHNQLFTDNQIAILTDPGRWRIISTLIPPDACPVQHPRHQQWMRTHTHTHREQELFLCLHGQAAYGYHGQVYPTEPGTILLFDSGEAHDLCFPPWSPDIDYLRITFCAEYLYCRAVSQRTGHDPAENRHCSLPYAALGMHVPRHLFARHAMEYLPPSVQRFSVCSALGVIFASVMHAGTSEIPPQPEGHAQHQMMLTVLRQIESTAGKGITLEGLAEHYGYCVAHFAALFRQYIGLSFQVYLNLCRMRKTYELEQLGYPKKVISSELGFASPSSFSRWYKHWEHWIHPPSSLSQIADLQTSDWHGRFVYRDRIANEQPSSERSLREESTTSTFAQSSYNETDSQLFTDDIISCLTMPDQWRIISSHLPAEIAPVAQEAHAQWLQTHTHTHAFQELVIGLHGETTHGYDGAVYPIGRGTILVLDSLEAHDLVYPPWSPDIDHLWLTTIGDNLHVRYLTIRNGQVSENNLRRTFTPDDIGVNPHRLLYHRLSQKDLPPHIRRFSLCSAIGVILSFLMYEEVSASLRHRGKILPEHSMQSAQRLIESTAGKDITLEALAERSGYSTQHFAALFKQYAGCTLQDYINRCRRRRTAELEACGYTKKAIAAELGFASPSSFSRWYKRWKQRIQAER